MAHYTLARWRVLAEQELPEVLEELEQLGGLRMSLLDVLPHSVTGGLRAGDEDLRGLAARRPVVEGALAAVASRTPGLAVRRGRKVEALVAGSDVVVGVPHVRGVLTGDGEFVAADLVVDAISRNSPLAGMPDGHVVRRGSYRSVKELIAAIGTFIEADRALPPVRLAQARRRATRSLLRGQRTSTARHQVHQLASADLGD